MLQTGGNPIIDGLMILNFWFLLLMLIDSLFFRVMIRVLFDFEMYHLLNGVLAKSHSPFSSPLLVFRVVTSIELTTGSGTRNRRELEKGKRDFTET